MKKKWLKKSSAILLSLTMVLSLFPGMNGTIPTVQAAEKHPLNRHTGQMCQV